jgi:TRAP transporter TatT component family protein
MRGAALAAALALAAACSVKKLAVNSTATLMRDGTRAFDAEPDVEIARAAAPAFIKNIEGLLTSAPKDRTLLALAARSCLDFAFGFLEDDVESLSDERAAERRVAVARATQMYDRAAAYAVRLLATYDATFPAALGGDDARLDAAAARLPAGALAGLTYAGMAMASATNLDRSDPARIADLPKARILLERARAIDPAFEHGGATMVLAMIAVQAGDEPRARRLFDEAAAVDGGKYLLPRVMMARTLFVQTRAATRFRSTLQAALAAHRDALPAARLANEIARRRAARYLDEARRFFAAQPR